MLEALAHRIDCWLFEPPDSVIGKPIWHVLRILRYPYAVIRDVTRGDLTLRAMSLVYTTLLSIVPLIALSFSVLKGLGYHQDLEPVLYQFMEPMGDKGHELASNIMSFVNNVRGDVLGSIGLAFLLYTVISMIQKIEESFNFVWRVEQPRSFGRRFSEYLSVMVVGPVVIVSALGLFAALGSSAVMQKITAIEPFGTMLIFFGNLVPYFLVAAVFTFMYGFIPNTRVHVRAAGIGGLVGGILWAASGMLFTAFVANSANTEVIYAGFAIMVVALVWVYLSWIVLLLGAQLSFYVQHPQYLRPGRGEIRLTSTLRERLALAMMYLIARDFRVHQERWTLNRLAEHLDIPSGGLSAVAQALEGRGLLVLTEDEAWVPGRDPECIELIEILDAVRNHPSVLRLNRTRSIAPAEEVARTVDAAMKDALKGKTVKDLVNAGKPSLASDSHLLDQNRASAY